MIASLRLVVLWKRTPLSLEFDRNEAAPATIMQLDIQIAKLSEARPYLTHLKMLAISTHGSEKFRGMQFVHARSSAAGTLEPGLTIVMRVILRKR